MLWHLGSLTESVRTLFQTAAALQCFASQLLKIQTQTARHITSARSGIKKMHVTWCRKGLKKCTAAMSLREPPLGLPMEKSQRGTAKLYSYIKKCSKSTHHQQSLEEVLSFPSLLQSISSTMQFLVDLTTGLHLTGI